MLEYLKDKNVGALCPPLFLPAKSCVGHCESKKINVIKGLRIWETKSLGILDTGEPTGIADLCSRCRVEVRRFTKKTRQDFWVHLPTFYGLPPWENLEDGWTACDGLIGCLMAYAVFSIPITTIRPIHYGIEVNLSRQLNSVFWCRSHGWPSHLLHDVPVVFTWLNFSEAWSIDSWSIAYCMTKSRTEVVLVVDPSTEKGTFPTSSIPNVKTLGRTRNCQKVVMNKAYRYNAEIP